MLVTVVIVMTIAPNFDITLVLQCALYLQSHIFSYYDHCRASGSRLRVGGSRSGKLGFSVLGLGL